MDAWSYVFAYIIFYVKIKYNVISLVLFRKKSHSVLKVVQVMQAEEWNDEVPLRGIVQVVQVMQVVSVREIGIAL